MQSNPWADTPEESPHVLEMDAKHIEDFNAKQKNSDYRYEIKSVLPEPFIGDVHRSPIIILQLNPGFDPIEDPASHADPNFRDLHRKNLLHLEAEFPFYFFDPSLKNHPGSLWWNQRAGKLLKEVGPIRLARGLAVVEYFPYKSKKFKDGCRVPSQEYGFQLVRNAMSRDAVIIVSRASSRWNAAIDGLDQYHQKINLSSQQNVSITPNNLIKNETKNKWIWKMLIDKP